MDDSYPKYLYKYRSLHTPADVKHTAEIFEDHTLYLAAAEQYNDPFECRFKFNFRASTIVKAWKFAEVIKRQDDSISEEEAMEQATMLARGPQTPQMERNITLGMVKLIRTTMGILSVTEERDPILMWSHYADSHRGVCLQFDTSVGKPTNILRTAMPVRYRNEIPVLDYFTGPELDMAYDTAARKSEVWEYEHEWRTIRPDAARTRVSFPSEALSGVILGKEISQDNRDLVLGWVAKQDQDVTVEQADLDPDTYSLSFSPVTV